MQRALICSPAGAAAVFVDPSPLVVAVTVAVCVLIAGVVSWLWLRR